MCFNVSCNAQNTKLDIWFIPTLPCMLYPLTSIPFQWSPYRCLRLGIMTRHLSISKDLLMRTISLHVYFHIYEELFLDYCILTHVHFHIHIFSICQYEYRPPPAAPVLINEVPAKLAILFWHEAPKFAAKLHNEPRPSVHLNYIGSPNEWTWCWPYID